MMDRDRRAVAKLEEGLGAPVRGRVEAAVERIVAAKQRGGGVVVVTGRGPHGPHGGATPIAGRVLPRGGGRPGRGGGGPGEGGSAGQGHARRSGRARPLGRDAEGRLAAARRSLR